ncbi:YraN family protein [Cohnella endophytica]|uniref:UPF0102 protein D7Z26_09635 n=1 Tax=Cohnella endophytica TaxID=2419778 RepID=A0A494Y2H1_9BACL|nr:YraN family protein [Cohnella endophytica]
MSRRAEVGRAGEDSAADYLRQLGYVLIERNWRCRSGELDLIAQDGATLVIVEVRSRTNPTRFGTALEAMTPRKCRQVRELASIYLKSRRAEHQSVRFDVVAVTFALDGAVQELKHIEGAF